MVTVKSAESDNYKAGQTTVNVTVGKATYDMTGVAFNDVTATYDGQAHVATVTGTLPEGVSVAYENNSRTDVGEQIAKAKFTGNANYNAIADMTATVTIKAIVKTDEEGKVSVTYAKDVTVADVTSEEGVSVKELFENAQADVADETAKKTVEITVASEEAGADHRL